MGDRLITPKHFSGLLYHFKDLKMLMTIIDFQMVFDVMSESSVYPTIPLHAYSYSSSFTDGPHTALYQ